MKQLFFLSGIARSGSTLLGSILNQNPELHVSPTSPLLDLFCMTEEALSKLHQQYTFDLPAISLSIHGGLYKLFYANVSKPYVIDKHRGWPKNISIIKQVITPEPKIIATYRPIAESVTSFLKLMRYDPQNVIDKELKQHGQELTTRNRAMWLWERYFLEPYCSFKQGLDEHPECIHVVRYHDLIGYPNVELSKVYQFLGLPLYEGHFFENVQNTCAEQKDEQWGFKGLHNIRPTLAKTSDDSLDVLGRELCEYFAQFDRQLKVVK